MDSGTAGISAHLDGVSGTLVRREDSDPPGPGRVVIDPSCPSCSPPAASGTDYRAAGELPDDDTAWAMDIRPEPDAGPAAEVRAAHPPSALTTPSQPKEGRSPASERAGTVPDAPTKRADAMPDAPTKRADAMPDAPTKRAGAMPDAPAKRAGASGLSRRLRAMLPKAGGPDPVALVIRAHRAIHSSGEAHLLRRAYTVAEKMHRGQTRKSGEPYITHPLAVAQILAELGMDTVALAAALLHDTVEDTSYTLQALASEFGPEVALLVDGVTKFDKMFYGEAAEAETIRKMIVTAGRDVRVLVIKLADRLHNMRTLDARSPSSQTRIARATRDVLVPLCDRLGIQALKRELEDCVLRALHPSGYALISDHVKHRPGRDAYLHRVIAAVSAELHRVKVDAEVKPRPRHLYSIWKDTVSGNHPQPHDLPRIVLVVDGPETDCYAALGAVHGRWRPVPGRFKDFIASPKNNLYRSLHTTVIGPEDQLLEVLIRTRVMHRCAEYGIVVNFRFPHDAARFGPSTRTEQLAWLRKVLEWESSAVDPGQFLASLRCDLAESQIIVFTSTGRAVLLPAEATPVDLAYTVSADLGGRCVGAKLNGRLVPLSSSLADGDVVEIITRPGHADELESPGGTSPAGPERAWLDFVKTPHARLHITRWFTDHEAPAVTISDKVRLGRVAIGLALRQKGRGLASDLPLLQLTARLGYPDLETLLVAVADHALPACEVVDQLIATVDQTPPWRT